jgi:NTP pyrophosphatase (non-canonical NTP hydrolase)
MLSESLRGKLLEFRAERDWEKFHNLRTLSASIVLESAELLELTQWTPDTELDDVASERRGRIKHEIADLAILITYLVHDLKIDLEQSVLEKLAINAKKYPVDKAKGISLKYDELE